MMAHEAKETPAMERKEHGLKKGAKLPKAYGKAKGMMGGGMVGYMHGGAVSGNRGKNMVAKPGPKAPMVVKAGSAKLKGK
jgi:hypothetical protein